MSEDPKRYVLGYEIVLRKEGRRWVGILLKDGTEAARTKEQDSRIMAISAAQYEASCLTVRRKVGDKSE